jgi:hypothetical protein
MLQAVSLCAIALFTSGCTQHVSRAVVREDIHVDAAPVKPVARFSDVTEAAGVEFKQASGACGLFYFVEQNAAGASFLDANNDGFLDIYFPQPKVLGKCTAKLKQPLHQRLYFNDGKGYYQLAGNAFGGHETDYGMSAAVGDYDNDGDADLYVCCYGRNTLYRNRGNGTFEDVTLQAGVGLRGMSSSAAFFDYDNDGYLDLYVCRYSQWSPEKNIRCRDAAGNQDTCHPNEYPAMPDALYHNNGDGTYSDVTQKSGIGRMQARRALGVAAADFNTDGKLDLFVTNDVSANYLYINQGNGKFVDMAMQKSVAFGLGGKTQANMGIAVGDYDDNATLDAFVTTFTAEPYTLYRNEQEYFTDVSGSSGIFRATLPYLSFGAGFIDTTNRGLLDLFCANGHVSLHVNKVTPQYTYKQRNQLLMNDGKGRFTDDLAALPKDNVRVHRGAAFGDIDNDGKVDILVTANDDRPTLLRNESQGTGNWLLLKLTNKHGSVTPIGTRCIATINGKKKLRVVLGGGSYAGESDHRVHFGLGSATTVEKLEIRWLSGYTQILENVSANQILTLKEPMQNPVRKIT